MGYLFCYCVHKMKILLMRFLAYANFSRSQKQHKARTLCNCKMHFRLKQKDSSKMFSIKIVKEKRKKTPGYDCTRNHITSPCSIWTLLVYNLNHLLGLGSDTETKTENWPKLLADTKTNRNHNILNWKALNQRVCKKFS